MKLYIHLLSVPQPAEETKGMSTCCLCSCTINHIFNRSTCYTGIKARCVAESVINDGVNCQNGGTEINKCTCLCPGGLFGTHCESNLARTC